MNQQAVEFHQRAKAFFIQNPKLSFTILAKPPAEDAERQLLSANAWFSYLNQMDLDGTAACWRAILTGGGKAVTVPSERPEFFDGTYVPPVVEPHWNAPAPAKPYRGDLQQVLDRTMGELRAAKPKGRAPTYEPEPERVTMPKEWLDDQIENPRPVPALSDEAIARFNSGRQAA